MIYVVLIVTISQKLKLKYIQSVQEFIEKALGVVMAFDVSALTFLPKEI